MSHRRCELTQLCGLRKQVTEAKEGPLELRRKSNVHTMREENGKERHRLCVCVCVCERERQRGRESKRDTVFKGLLSGFHSRGF